MLRSIHVLAAAIMAQKNQNQAAWITAAKASLVVKDDTETPTPTPGQGELLVKVKCIAFSPIEAKIQKFVRYSLLFQMSRL